MPVLSTTIEETTPAVLRPVLEPLPPLTAAGSRLLDAAAELFYERGVRAVGVDLIAEVAGTTKKTLYDRFGSKDALVALYLLQRAHRWRDHLLARLEQGDAPVPAVFDALESWLDRGLRGCAFVNAYAEVGVQDGARDGADDHPALPVIRAEKAWMRALFDELTGDAVLGGQVHLVYEGTLVLLTAGANPAAVVDARRAVTTLLGR